MSGDHFISPTVTRFKEVWWLFASVPGNDTLRLFYARDLKGPWTEHPQSPIVKKDLHTVRPAGRPLVVDGVLYRLGMDCYPTYGRTLRNWMSAFVPLSTTGAASTECGARLGPTTPSPWASLAFLARQFAKARQTVTEPHGFAQPTVVVILLAFPQQRYEIVPECVAAVERFGPALKNRGDRELVSVPQSGAQFSPATGWI